LQLTLYGEMGHGEKRHGEAGNGEMGYGEVGAYLSVDVGKTFFFR
jgi:hypothetical protein